MELLKRMWSQLTQMWERLSNPYRVSLGAITALLIFSMVWGLTTVSTDGMVLLINSDEKPDEARQIKEKLEQANERFEVRQGGIYVPKENRARILLESGDIVGDEILYQFLQESNLTISQWQLKQSLHIANQRKLERMIAQITSVRGVSIKITEQSRARAAGFRTGAKATAAVTIDLKAGKDFSRDNIKAVANLVAASVESLQAEDVQIMDTKGRLYRLPEKGGIWETATTQLDAVRLWVGFLEQSVLKLYPDAKVAAQVKLDPNETRTKKETFGEPVDVEREKRELTETGKTSARETGMKGTGREVTDSGPGLTTDESRDESESRSKADVPKEWVDIKTAPGDVKESSVTVMIPVYKQGSEDDTALQTRIQQRTTNETQVVTTNISRATGITENLISVQFIAAAPPLPPEALSFWQQFTEFLKEWGGTIFLWALALFALLMLYMLLKRAMPKDVMDEIDEMRKRLEDETAPAAPELAASEVDVARMKMGIREMVNKNPRSVATILKRWISGK